MRTLLIAILFLIMWSGCVDGQDLPFHIGIVDINTKPPTDYGIRQTAQTKDGVLLWDRLSQCVLYNAYNREQLQEVVCGFYDESDEPAMGTNSTVIIVLSTDGKNYDYYYLSFDNPLEPIKVLTIPVGGPTNRVVLT